MTVTAYAKRSPVQPTLPALLPIPLVHLRQVRPPRTYFIGYTNNHALHQSLWLILRQAAVYRKGIRRQHWRFA